LRDASNPLFGKTPVARSLKGEDLLAAPEVIRMIYGFRSGNVDSSGGRRSVIPYWIVALLGLAMATPASTAGEPSKGTPTARCIVVEVYFQPSDQTIGAVVETVQQLKAVRGGLSLVQRNLSEQPRYQERLAKIAKHFELDASATPVIYVAGSAIHATPENKWQQSLESALRFEVFVRGGCSRCAHAKSWLQELSPEYPGLDFVFRDVAEDAAARAHMSSLVKEYRVAAASVPVFHTCNQLIVGFDRPESTGQRIRKLLERWSHPCTETTSESKSDSPTATPDNTIGLHSVLRPFGWQLYSNYWMAWITGIAQAGNDRSPADDQADLPLPEETPLNDLPIDGGEEESAGTAPADSGLSSQGEDQIELPLLGSLSASRLGMPLFTLAVGLVDGFNPCAMWVLLFLLSILVNLRDRTRILAIAGTFVVVSGLAYLAFMAAWLSVFSLIGYLRLIQVSLAILAILIGAVHIKDFFAFKQGISLSIPESAKPGIYARVRQIVTAENLTGAVIGAIVLAVLVNIVELLCTAGLPALYTNILTQQNYSVGVRFAYLMLYILAYMFDDVLMVTVVVWTLNKQKLQESHGRWLKLLSGMAILLLGIVMLVKPEWLH